MRPIETSDDGPQASGRQRCQTSKVKRHSPILVVYSVKEATYPFCGGPRPIARRGLWGR